MNLTIKNSLLGIVALLVSMQVWALSSDKDQPLEIEADQASIDDAKGETIYEGNVMVSQGTLNLRAAKVSLTYDKNKKVDTIRAQGNPAYFKQRPDGRKDDIKASAQVMEFNVKADILNLRTNAKIEQGKDVFTGENITYEAKRGLIKATGGGSKGRVKVTVQPDSLRHKTE
jgi:lipopolysaccharide export system protein LptA